MKAEEIRRAATRGGHNLGPFSPVPMGIGPVATCGCGLGVTQQRRGPGRGATLVWHSGRNDLVATPGAVRAQLEADCPRSPRRPFHARLVHELTQLDLRLEATEIRQRLPVNYYRIGIFLQAAESCAQEVAEGATEATAFIQNFTPSRDMHRIARRLGLPLDVERGDWISQTTQP